MEKQQQKWEGKARAKVNRVRAEQVWPLLEDFCSFHKWLPSIDTCRLVEGVNGQPGLVRYCSSSSSSPHDDDDDEVITWCHEKLISIDPVVRCLSYEILNNNLGFKSYVSTIKVLPLKEAAKAERDTDDEELEMGCEIEWSFLSDPVDGMTCEALSSYIHSSLQGVAHNIEKSFALNNS